MSVRACDIPADGLLQTYVGRGETYTDCFEVTSPKDVTLAKFVEAFYTTWLFRMERFVLSALLRRRILDEDVQALANGADRFAVWFVEARTENQLLLCELTEHTRSYLAISHEKGGETRLLFGSAVVPKQDAPLGRVVTALAPLHRFYSKCLLRLAARKLRLA